MKKLLSGPCATKFSTLLAILAVGSSGVVSANLPREKPLQKVTLQLKWYHQFQFAGFYAAKEKGFYENEGLDVTLLEGGPNCGSMEHVLSGSADFGIASSELLLARMQGEPTVACATIFQHSAYVLLASKKSGIKGPSDFVGRRVHVSASAGAAQFRAMLKREGVPLDTIEFVKGPWSLGELMTGQVDAISGYMSTQAPYLRSVGQEIQEIDPRNYGVDFYGDTLFTTERYLRYNRKVVEAMTRASLQGWEYAMENPEELVDQIMTMPTSRHRIVTRSLLLEEAEKMRLLVVPDVVAIGQMNPDRWANIARIYQETGQGRIPEDPRWIEDFIFDPEERKKATLFHLAMAANLIGLVGLLIFTWSLILRRQVAERTAEVREQSHLNQLILDTAMDAVIGLDQEGRICSWNGQSSLMFGEEKEEALGRNIEEFIPELLKRSKDEENSSRFETDARRGCGETFPAELSLSRVEDSATVRLNVFVRDITERRGLEESLRQSQKMQSIGQLAGGVAHDFNNLLTVIQGNAMLTRTELSDENHERLSEIVEASERASGLTRQLLAFSRQQPMQLKMVDVNDSVNGVGKMIKRLIGEDISLKIDLTEDSTQVKADPGLLEQVILNLAVNARDAMPEGGDLTIETRLESLEEGNPRLSGDRTPGDYVRVRVSDTGVGIEKEHMSRIFEPFFTTKDVGKGTGLGLATVFGIVQQHDGWMSVDSEVGEGTDFQVWFPANSERADSENAKNTRSPARVPTSTGSETVLLVEDEAMVRTVARKLLTMHGYQVIEADCGRAALEKWKQCRDDIDILLTDVVMPEGMTGHQLAAELQEDRPDLQVIYTSGYTAEVFRGEAEFPEDAIFLGKPYLPEELLTKVREALDAVVLPA